jgi:hypothetical protein
MTPLARQRAPGGPSKTDSLGVRRKGIIDGTSTGGMVYGTVTATSTGTVRVYSQYVYHRLWYRY